MFVIGSRVVALFLSLGAGGIMACAHSSQQGATADKPGATDDKPGASDKPTPTTIPGQQDRVPGEYLVSLQKGGDEALIRKVFAPYSVRDVQTVSENLFLLKIDQDPGPDAMKRKREECDQIRSVQPNFVYRLKPSPGKIDGSIK